MASLTSTQWLRALLCCSTLLVSAYGWAQVVNIENKRLQNDTARWTGQAGLRFNVVENTQRSTDFGTTGSVQFIEGKHRAFFVMDMNLSRVERNAFLNTGFQHLRYQRHWRGIFSWEGYTQMQYNKPLRVDLRWTTGGGLRAVVRNSDDLRLSMGSSILFEHEVDRVNDLYYNDFRISNYISAGWKLEPNLQLTTILYYQPVIADASDHRIALEAQLRIRATKRFAFDTRINLQKDTKMAPGIPELNYRWQNTFTFLL